MANKVRLSCCVEMVIHTDPWVDRLDVVAQVGMPAFEFWGWPGKDLDAIKRKMDRLGLQLSIFSVGTAADSGYNDWRRGAWLNPEMRSACVDAVRESCKVAKQLGSPSLIVTCGNEIPGVPREEQRRSLVDGLKAAAPVLEDAGITMCLEPLNVLVDHKGYFLASSAEAFEIVREVGSPRVKVLYDIYHQQITEGNLIATITANIGLIGHFHVADVPGRHEPGTGEINYGNVFDAIAKSGYQHYVGLEYSPTRDAAETLRGVMALA
jgi:hydroxypyruvate isomerase